MIWWQSSALPIPEGRFDLAYSIRKSNYRGNEEIQIQWVDFRQIEPAMLITPTRKPELQIIDMRKHRFPGSHHPIVGEGIRSIGMG